MTTRAAILALVVCALSVSLAYPLREYLQQRTAIATLEARVAEQKAAVAAAKAEYDRWQDPAYIRAQAKARLHMVDPGERQYVVVEPEATTDDKVPTSTAGATSTPWFGALWNSIEEADSTPR